MKRREFLGGLGCRASPPSPRNPGSPDGPYSVSSSAHPTTSLTFPFGDVNGSRLVGPNPTWPSERSSTLRPCHRPKALARDPWLLITEPRKHHQADGRRPEGCQPQPLLEPSEAVASNSPMLSPSKTRSRGAEAGRLAWMHGHAPRGLRRLTLDEDALDACRLQAMRPDGTGVSECLA